MSGEGPKVSRSKFHILWETRMKFDISSRWCQCIPFCVPPVVIVYTKVNWNAYIHVFIKPLTSDTHIIRIKLKPIYISSVAGCTDNLWFDNRKSLTSGYKASAQNDSSAWSCNLPGDHILPIYPRIQQHCPFFYNIKVLIYTTNRCGRNEVHLDQQCAETFFFSSSLVVRQLVGQDPWRKYQDAVHLKKKDAIQQNRTNCSIHFNGGCITGMENHMHMRC